eukprot:scaffold2582_cov162-Ochromonas_danica.AAC.29
MKAVLSLLLVLPALICSFRHLLTSSPLRARTQLQAGQGLVIVGAAGSAAENAAAQILQANPSEDLVLWLDKRPFSPLLNGARANVKVLYGEKQDREVLKQILKDRVLVALEDPGDLSLRDDDEEGKEWKNPSLPLLAQVAKAVPEGQPSKVVLATFLSDSGDLKGPLAFFSRRGSTAIKEWAKQEGKPLSVICFEKVVGGVPGREPPPFLSIPLTEPELHPSYRLTSAQLSLPQPQMKEAVSTRQTLGQLISVLVEEEVQVEALLTSTTGPELSREAWTESFQRLETSVLPTLSKEVQLLRMEASSVRPSELLSFLADEWLPRALLDADIAVLSSGARPTRAVRKADDELSIEWEELDEDLTVRNVGRLVLSLQRQPAGSSNNNNSNNNNNNGNSNSSSTVLFLRRESDKKRVLPVEAKLVESLIEALRTDAVRRRLLTLSA